LAIGSNASPNEAFDDTIFPEIIITINSQGLKLQACGGFVHTLTIQGGRVVGSELTEGQAKMAQA
jgi:hypothetical protein